MKYLDYNMLASKQNSSVANNAQTTTKVINGEL